MAKKTSRRALIKAAAAGGVVAGFGIGMTPRAATEAGEAAQDGQHDHHAPPVTGPMANAIVSFGAWPANAANVLDRSPNRSPNNRNVHQLIPHEVTIKAGGTVNFVIAGFHWVAVYDNGTKPEDIDVPVFDPMNPATLFINDPNNRIYRGLDPSTLTILTNVQPNPAPPLAPILVGTFYALGVRDRVEVVQFANPGRYLVICLINPHFKNPASGEFEMFGHVNVIP